MNCNCNRHCKTGRIQPVNGFWGGLATGVGNIAKLTLPVFAPVLVGIGTRFVADKIGGKQRQAETSTPAPLASTEADVVNRRNDERSSISIGAVVGGAILLALILK